MSKKILAVLAAVVALMAIPAIAQATQLQEGGKEIADGGGFMLQSLNVKMATQNKAGEEKGSLFCKHTKFEGTLVKNQVKDPLVKIPTATFGGGCDLVFGELDVTTNATAKEPWQLRIQEPDTKSQIVAHLEPFESGAKGQVLGLHLQFQTMGSSFQECDFSSKGIQFMGDEAGNTWKAEGTKQATRQAGNAVTCNETGDFTGTFGSWTPPGVSVTVDGTPI